jgi:hypothetical protein
VDINALFPSNFLKAADLKNQPRTVTIESCTLEQVSDGEHKPVLHFIGVPKGLVLNKTNSQTLGNAFGYETDHWPGKQIMLFSTPVNFQGRMVDAVRIQAAPPSAHVPPPQTSPSPTQVPQPKPVKGEFDDDIKW